MYCPHCGAKMPENTQYCPSCGQKNDSIAPPPYPTTPVRKKFPWLKWLAVLLIVTSLILAIFYIASKDLTQSIEGQLQALRNDKLTEAYYSFTSKDFQKNISLERFREFARNTPALLNNKSIQFTDSSFENNILILKGILISSDNQTQNIEYKLVDEDGDWKIMSIELLNTENKEPTEKTPLSRKRTFQGLIQQQLKLAKASQVAGYTHPASKFLKTAVDQQLSALSTGKIEEAYALTAREFQQNTPFELFSSYIQEFPLLRVHDSVTYGQSLVENEVGVIEVELYHSGKAMTVDYALKQESGNWKIWGMQINQTVPKGELVLH